jgi:trans-aconitate methyltransferase
MTPDFSRRNNLVELMDSDETDFETFRDCLIDLARVNQLTLSYRPTLQFLARLAKQGRLPRDRAIRIIDVGSGYGDMLRKIDRWAARRGLQMELIGIDRNPWSAQAGEAATLPGRPIRFFTADVFEFKPSLQADIVLSSLFAHHLDDKLLIRFLSWMEANARIAWFVNDLHRHAIPYHLFRPFSRTMGFHDFVQHDGPVSIARAFDVADWRNLLAAADIPVSEVAINWLFPFRLCVSRVRSA